ncbi:MAG TPA: ABC transporter permease [Candidatus Korarchaeota archaeon]|nr:ABC transporter permease [Candidatus Korarchaeota archaeon]
MIEEGLRKGLRIIPIVDKEIRQLIRDPKTILMVLLMPIAVTILFGYGYGGKGAGKYPITVVDLDGREGAFKFIQELKNSKMFEIKAVYKSKGQGFSSVYSGTVYASLIIPETFTEDLMRGRPTRVELYYDASNPSVAQMIMQAVGVVTQQYQEWAASKFGTFTIKPMFYTIYGPKIEKIESFIPILMAMILQMVPTSLISVSICREREKGTFEQFIMTPVRVSDIIFGKLAAYFLATISDAILSLLTAILLFDVKLRGSFFDMAMVSTVFLLNSLSLGLLISVFSKNQLQAYQASIFSFIIFILFSGVFVPVDVLSPEAKLIASLVPMYYFVTAFRSVSLKGWGLLMVSEQLLTINIFTLVFLLLSLRFLRMEVI